MSEFITYSFALGGRGRLASDSPSPPHPGCGRDAPTVEVVTLAALQGETQSLMIGRSRFLKRFQVATRALCRKTLPIELSYRSHFVTGIAIHNRVRTDQREPVLMFVDVVNGDLPTVHAVTDVALRPIFAAVQVGMAILALLANVAEDGIKMAFLAGYVDVHAAERIGRLVVIKLRVLANRHPSCRRMTILAGRFQGAMRIRRRQRSVGSRAVVHAESHGTGKH